MKNMNKPVQLVYGIFSLVLLAIIAFHVVPKADSLLGGRGTSGCKRSAATSSPAFLTTTGASTTIDCQTDSAELLGVNLFLVSSSSATELFCARGFSQNKEEWYWETTKQVNANGQVIIRASTTRRFAPAFAGHGGQTQATSTFHDQLDPVAGTYTRYECNVGGAAGSLWLEMVKRVQF